MHITPQNRSIVWAIALLNLLFHIAGYIWDLYDRLWWFDKFLHLYTPFAITLLLALYLYGVVLTGARDRPLLLVLTIASLGIAISGLWEVAEWGYDQIVAGNAIKGKLDTILDLIMGSIGSILAGLVSLWMVQPESRAEYTVIEIMRH